MEEFEKKSEIAENNDVINKLQNEEIVNGLSVDEKLEENVENGNENKEAINENIDENAIIDSQTIEIDYVKQEEELFGKVEELRLELKEKLLKFVEDIVYELKMTDRLNKVNLLYEVEDMEEIEMNENNVNYILEVFWSFATKHAEKDFSVKETTDVDHLSKDTAEETESINKGNEDDNNNLETIDDEEKEESNEVDANDIKEILTNVLFELNQEPFAESLTKWIELIYQLRKLQLKRELNEELLRKLQKAVDETDEIQEVEEIIARTPTPPPISYTQVLTDCTPTLLDTLILDNKLLSQLEKCSVLNPDMVLDIKCRANRIGKVRRLIEFLLKLGPQSLTEFIKALKETETHSFLANILSFRTYT